MEYGSSPHIFRKSRSTGTVSEALVEDSFYDGIQRIADYGSLRPRQRPRSTSDPTQDHTIDVDNHTWNGDAIDTQIPHSDGVRRFSDATTISHARRSSNSSRGSLSRSSSHNMGGYEYYVETDDPRSSGDSYSFSYNSPPISVGIPSLNGTKERQSFLRFMRGMPLLEAFVASPLIAIIEDFSISQALQVLFNNGISTAPVYSKNRHFLGMISLMDILSPFLLREGMQINILLTASIMSILDSTGRVGRFEQFNIYKTVWDLLAAFSTGTKKVFILDPINLKVERILGPLDLIEILIPNFKIMKSWLFEPIIHLGMVTMTIRCAKDSLPTREVINMLYDPQVEAVGIVDKNEKFLGYVDRLSLKLFHSENLNFLNRPVVDFLAIQKVPTVCGVMDNLATVMLKMGVERVHSVWILEKKGRVQGLVTLKEILRIVFDNQGAKLSELSTKMRNFWDTWID
eukprot:TRINITY_DN10783_c0_g1_i1.p1 TRINITY_DN10783_c0_g1~~TRINITY_DN10783_c0_g1_i1.p1  ORF type:complete len:458 (+),score=104.68 TRINITY_DN10783_c0_g1_i1:68-1441(+)